MKFSPGQPVDENGFAETILSEIEKQYVQEEMEKIRAHIINRLSELSKQFPK